MKFLLQGTLVAKPGSRDALIAIMNRAAALMLEKAQGCELYTVGFSNDDKDIVYITEIWASKADHEASLSIPGVRELIGEAMPILAEMPNKGKEILITSS